MKVDRKEFLKRKIEEHIHGAKETLKLAEGRKDRVVVNALTMECFQAVNYALDFMEEIIKERKLGIGFSYRDYVDILVSNNLMDEKTAKEISYLTNLRNRIAHEYHVITEKEVFKMAKLLGVLERLLKIE